MKKTIIYSIIGLLVLGLGYKVYANIQKRKAEKAHQEWVATLPNTASPNVHILTDTIHVPYLNEKRTLALYLPKGYESDSMDYPVVYFLDGQSLFDQKINEGAEWKVDEVLDSLGLLGQQQAIVVGIYNSERRMKEYKPFPSTRWYSDWIVSGDLHADWIAKTVKPWIDQRYRTQTQPESTMIAGASLGGLMSYYMLMEYSHVFGKAFVFSPSYWVNEVVYTLHEDNPNLIHQKIYFNAGELETPTVDGIRKMEQILLDFGMPAKNMKLDVEKDLGHWHMTWEKGFQKSYPWMVSDD